MRLRRVSEAREVCSLLCRGGLSDNRRMGLAARVPGRMRTGREARPGTGVTAATSTGGGAAVGAERPTSPVSTAMSTAAPTVAIMPASSQWPRSEGGAGIGRRVAPLHGSDRT